MILGTISGRFDRFLATNVSDDRKGAPILNCVNLEHCPHLVRALWNIRRCKFDGDGVGSRSDWHI